MSNSSDKPQLPNKVIDLLVNDIFNKNDINMEKAKGNLSDEQRQMLKEMVQDLTKQVDSFLDSSQSQKE